jgi:hypothetical protein
VLINEKDIKNINNIFISFGNLLFSNDKNRDIAKDMSLISNINDVKIDPSAEASDKTTFSELKTFLSKLLS